MYHYPPMSAAPLPGQLRGGAHTDFGSLTLLYGEPSVRGLQIWNGEEWEDAPVVDGAIVINIGDLMQRWTNDEWNSTLHRVANPIDGEWDRARYSMAFFHQPHHDAVIESLDLAHEAKYPPITSGEHFQRKLDALILTSS
ncbi:MULTISPECIES: 2OG-Fe(II) oxygenase family protein [Rhodococcus]|uniref:2OG-Fe(II) oxygenase family protein n=1 Tax=Rhodococcus TaxID=1827 RepID=UPI00214C5975|nr:2OG-Fe(II) oxygenase family protein [Rhodococcus sp. LW-XY12]